MNLFNFFVLIFKNSPEAEPSVACPTDPPGSNPRPKTSRQVFFITGHFSFAVSLGTVGYE